MCILLSIGLFMWLSAIEASKVCVFCGSVEDEYGQEAYALGQFIAENGMHVICGGSQEGLMGQLINGAMDKHGYTIGVFPKMVQSSQTLNPRLSKVIHVSDLAECKRVMRKEASVFVVLPGGPGTLAEFADMWDSSRFLKNPKPIIILNINGFWSSLLDQMNNMKKHNFASDKAMSLFVVVKSRKELFDYLKELKKVIQI